MVNPLLHKLLLYHLHLNDDLILYLQKLLLHFLVNFLLHLNILLLFHILFELLLFGRILLNHINHKLHSPPHLFHHLLYMQEVTIHLLFLYHLYFLILLIFSSIIQNLMVNTTQNTASWFYLFFSNSHLQ